MIAILTDPGIGGTFLNWTIHYLSGDKEYYYAPIQSCVPLIENPVTGNNAHMFLANQPRNLSEFNTLHSRLQSWPTGTLYFHHFSGSTATFDADTRTAISQLDFVNDKVILLSLSHEHALYQCKYKTRAASTPSFQNNFQLHTNAESIYNDFVNYFFAESKKKWDGMQLTDIWDQREFIALNMDPFNVLSMNSLISNSQQHFKLDAVQLMTEFDQHVDHVFEYLEQDICESRREHWNQVYANWKLLHVNRLEFVRKFDTIVDHIVNGVDFDLEYLKLDIRQEAAIQHQLLFNHNLNLKTWQLIKFENTRQLHDLLEPNIYHDLSLCNLEKRQA